MRAISIPARTGTRPLRPKRLLALAGDDTLVEQMRRGNPAAYEVVFERHGAGILGFCRHMLGGHEEAEDAVQHTFAAAFRDVQRNHSRELALKPWLYAIARNRCTSVLRSRREEVALGAEPATAGLAEQVERRAELRELLRDVRELPEEQRAALLLAEAGGLSHAEVADVLGCEVARVKALVFRARSGLIERREAREARCEEIREQLANLRGGALRRTVLRHHLRGCPGCRAYREQVRQQRQMLAAALPVAPSLGLKSAVLAAIGIGGGSAGGGLAAGLGGVSASLGAGAAAKLAAVCVVAGGGAVAGEAVLDERRAPSPPTAADVAPERSGAAQRATPPASRQVSQASGPAVAREAPAAGERPVRQGGGRPALARNDLPSAGNATPIGKPKPKPRHRIKVKAVPPIAKAPEADRGPGLRERGAKIDHAPQGRGPIAAPPETTPVKRGPANPKPKPEKAAKSEVVPAAPVAAPAPEPSPAPEPKIKASPELEAVKQSKSAKQ